jgi:hypothetical protein
MDKHPENIICDFQLMKFSWWNFMDKNTNFHEIKFIQNIWLLEWTSMDAVAFNNDPDIPVDTPWTKVTRLVLGGKFRA